MDVDVSNDNGKILSKEPYPFLEFRIGELSHEVFAVCLIPGRELIPHALHLSQ